MSEVESMEISKFKIILIFFVVFFGVLGLAKSSWATDHYICKDCPSGNGSSWSSALNDMPALGTQYPCGYDAATWERGATYWVAGSDLAYHTACFRNVSGTGTITIKKATASEHGTDVGWQTSYGAKQAVINGSIGVQAVPNITIDGSYKYGIKMQSFYTHGTMDCPYQFGYQIKNIEITQPVLATANALSFCVTGSVSNPSDSNPNFLFKDSYIHDIGYGIQIGEASWLVFENNIIERLNHYNDTTHKEIIMGGGSKHVYLRRNRFIDWCGYYVTGGIVMQGGEDDWHIYNNLFYGSLGGCSGLSWGNRAVGMLDGQTYSNVYVFNNTFYNVSGANIMTSFGTNSITNGQVKNNLFYKSDVWGIGMTGVEKDYNWFYQTPNYSIRESHDVSGIADPFVDSTNYSLSLKAYSDSCPQDNGVDLSSYFVTDFADVSRPQGAGWDIGAYEYVGAAPPPDITPPNAPTGVTIS